MCHNMVISYDSNLSLYGRIIPIYTKLVSCFRVCQWSEMSWHAKEFCWRHFGILPDRYFQIFFSHYFLSNIFWPLFSNISWSFFQIFLSRYFQIFPGRYFSNIIFLVKWLLFSVEFWRHQYLFTVLKIKFA